MASNVIRKGKRVETSGKGRTAKWPHGVGTVTSVRSGFVYVVWDGTHFEDEMEKREVQLVGGDVPLYWSDSLNRYVTIPED